MCTVRVVFAVAMVVEVNIEVWCLRLLTGKQDCTLS